MALKTLENVKKIGEFNVIVMDKLRDEMPELFNEDGGMDWKYFEKNIRPNNFVYVRNDKNSLSFTIQDGPVKEAGRNGCDVMTVIEAAKIMLEGLNEQVRCRETSIMITKLEECLLWGMKRKMDREQRNVEGTDQE